MKRALLALAATLGRLTETCVTCHSTYRDAKK